LGGGLGGLGGRGGRGGSFPVTNPVFNYPATDPRSPFYRVPQQPPQPVRVNYNSISGGTNIYGGAYGYGSNVRSISIGGGIGIVFNPATGTYQYTNNALNYYSATSNYPNNYNYYNAIPNTVVG